MCWHVRAKDPLNRGSACTSDAVDMYLFSAQFLKNAYFKFEYSDLYCYKLRKPKIWQVILIAFNCY